MIWRTGSKSWCGRAGGARRSLCRGGRVSTERSVINGGAGVSPLRTGMCLIARPDPDIREEARQDMFDYIKMFYNPVRKQVRNGMLSPVEFERQQIVKAEGV